MTAAVVGIDPERARVLARAAGQTADDLRGALSRLRADLEGHCTGVPSLLGATAQWLWDASVDVGRRANAASDDRVFDAAGSGLAGASLRFDDALAGFVGAGNALAVRLMVAGLSKAQLLALADEILRSLSAADLTEDERLTYRRALLPLMARLLSFATEPAVEVYVGGSEAGAAALEVRRLMEMVGRLMLPPPHREGSGWEAFFRGMFLGDWDRGYTTPGLESARVTGLLLGSLIPIADVRDAAAAARNVDPLGFVLCAVSAYPIYGDLLRVASKTIKTGFRLSKSASRLTDLAVAADKLTTPIGPASSAASNISRGRAVTSGGRRAFASGSSASSVLRPRSGVVDLSNLPKPTQRTLQQVALGRVRGVPLARGGVGALPKKPHGHFTRYDAADGTSVITGKNAELYVSNDGGCTWSAVR